MGKGKGREDTTRRKTSFLLKPRQKTEEMKRTKWEERDELGKISCEMEHVLERGHEIREQVKVMQRK